MSAQKFINHTILLLLVLTVVACTKAPIHHHLNPKPGSGKEPVPVDTEISSIHELNRDQGYLNSHANEWQNSTIEMDYRSYMTLESPQLSAINALYPRIKRLRDGTFLLIYQQGPTAHDVYYALSNNLVSWQNSDEQLFAKTDMNQYESSVADRVLFSSADAIVLDNGHILAFASFRLNKGYRLNNLNNGIMMRRSTDNGKNWNEPTVIYRGTTWEPSALQLSSGEVHVYFTSADPNRGDSGTALLRSSDRGENWTDVGKIIRQHAGVAVDGSNDPIYTDQMPVAIQINGSSQIAVAFESRFGRTETSNDKYHLGMAYSDDNWASGGLTGIEEGPTERQSNLFLNQAAPYLRQFRSGETIHSCNITKKFNIRVGDSKAWEFGEPMQGFPDRGAMGSIEIIDDHTFMGVFPKVFTAVIDGITTDCSNIQMGRFVINHRINATAFTPQSIDSNSEWEGVQDALFIGSESQAQATFRFAYDNDNLYCLVERLDKDLGASDGMQLMIQGGAASGDPIILNISPNTGTETIVCDNVGVGFAATVLGTFDNISNDRGYVFTVAVPRSMIKVAMDRVLFNAILFDTGGNDTFYGLTATNYEKWLAIELKDPTEPGIEPEPGDNDSGQGPQWNDGEEANPWK